jgi:hypothetical protein
VVGGFTGGACPLRGPGQEAWAFNYKGAGWMQHGQAVTLTRLGGELGQEQRHLVDFRAGIWTAVWLSGHRFWLAGDGHFGVVDLDQSAPSESIPGSGPRTPTSAAPPASTSGPW